MRSIPVHLYIYICIYIYMYIYMCCPLWCTTNETMAHIISNPLGLGFGVEVQDLMLDKLHLIPCLGFGISGIGIRVYEVSDQVHETLRGKDCLPFGEGLAIQILFCGLGPISSLYNKQAAAVLWSFRICVYQSWVLPV